MLITAFQVLILHLKLGEKKNEALGYSAYRFRHIIQNQIKILLKDQICKKKKKKKKKKPNHGAPHPTADSPWSSDLLLPLCYLVWVGTEFPLAAPVLSFLGFLFVCLDLAFLGPHPQHMEVPRLGVEWEL